MRIRLALLMGLSLGGCALIDQTTFAPSPEVPQPEPPPPPWSKLDPRTPLLTIGYDVPDPHYQEPLRYAVRAAEGRAPGVQYDVVAMLPMAGDAAAVQGNAVEVMRVIMAQGVPASRIHLSMRSEAAGSPRQIRVYVR